MYDHEAFTGVRVTVNKKRYYFKPYAYLLYKNGSVTIKDYDSSVTFKEIDASQSFQQIRDVLANCSGCGCDATPVLIESPDGTIHVTQLGDGTTELEVNKPSLISSDANNNITLGVDNKLFSTPVTLSGVYDYLTILGQTITRNAINLANHVTGRLGFGNLVQGSGTSVVGKPTSGTGDNTNIQASADGQFLVRRSGALTFGSLEAADIPAATASKWITSGSDIYRISKVGIGTTTPTAELDVRGFAKYLNAIATADNADFPAVDVNDFSLTARSGFPDMLYGMRIKGNMTFNTINQLGGGLLIDLTTNATTSQLMRPLQVLVDGNLNAISIIRNSNLASLASASLRIEKGNGSNTGQLCEINPGNATNTFRAFGIYLQDFENSNYWGIGTGNTDYLRFFHNTASSSPGSVNPTMWIRDKRIGIGQYAAFIPDATLHIRGESTTTGEALRVTNSAPTTIITAFNAGGINVGSGAFTASPGIINAQTGLRINNAAAAGNYLRGNGTNFVSSPIQQSDITALNDIVLPSTGATYYGAVNTDGSWRTIRSGNDLLHQRRESGTWVTKQTITP
jgi:hypothetical protein